ncbi:MAG: IS200/IS605 family transposase [Acetobacteraceae bacterium]
MPGKRYVRNAKAVFSLTACLVWCPKYRRPVLVPPVDARLKQILTDVAADHGIAIHSADIAPDRVRLLIASDPTMPVAEIVARFKGRTSRILRAEFPTLRSRLPTLWNRSYLALTVGLVPEEIVARFIEEQRGK